MNTLDYERGTINVTDDLILWALAARMRAALEIERAKRQGGEKIICPAREREILDRLKEQAKKEGLDPQFINDVYVIIFNHSRKIQLEQRETETGPD